MKLVFTFTSSEKSMCRFIPVLPDGIPENNETLGIRVKRSSSVEIIPDITGVIADSDGMKGRGRGKGGVEGGEGGGGGGEGLFLQAWKRIPSVKLSSAKQKKLMNLRLSLNPMV